MKHKEMLENLYGSLVEKRKKVMESIVLTQERFENAENRHSINDEEDRVLSERIDNLLILKDEYDLQISELVKLLDSIPEEQSSAEDVSTVPSGDTKKNMISQLQEISDLISIDPSAARSKLEILISRLSHD